MEYKIIAWPNRERALRIMRKFQEINGFPRIIGAIDRSHIRICKPKHHPNSYCNRKNFHSVLLQGVCDSEKLFLDVYVGELGSIHDMRLFKKSHLYTGIINSSIHFPNDSHLVGDLAYKLSPYLLVGFKDVGGINNREKTFNKKLSQCRVVIENAYAYLKGRFRRLKYLETVRLDLCLLTVSACIMHNICILNGDVPEELVDDMEMRDTREYDAFIADMNEEQENNNQGVLKRIEIMNMLQIGNM